METQLNEAKRTFHAQQESAEARHNLVLEQEQENHDLRLSKLDQKYNVIKEQLRDLQKVNVALTDRFKDSEDTCAQVAITFIISPLMTFWQHI